VIDDVETEFPFSILKKQGYAIDYWADVNDLPKLESGFYDIIILDIGGIGQELDDVNEGVGVLRHIKQTNPSQIVIAYSGEAHDTHRIPFFQLADEYVPKPTNAISWKETLDHMIGSKCTVDHYWSTLEALLRNQGTSARNIARIERALVKACTGNTFDPCKFISKNLGSIENAATMLSIISKIGSLFS